MCVGVDVVLTIDCIKEDPLVFVDYHFEAPSLAFWPSPSWFFGARSDHIWTRG